MNFYPFYRRDIKIHQACLNKVDLKRLFSIVQAQLDKAVDIQIEKTNPDLFKDFEAVKQEIRHTMIIFYSITKAVEDAFSGYINPNFEASVFPERIETIFISTKS